MEWIVKIFLFILYTSITGTVMFFGWKGLGKLLHKQDDIIFAYYCLRVIAISFVIPILALVLWLQTHRGNTIIGWAFDSTRTIQIVITVISVIWAGGAILSFLACWSEMSRVSDTKRLNFPVTKEMNKLFKKSCERVQVKKQVRLREGKTIKTPFITGVFRPQIYLPSKGIDEEDLEIVLIHELMHEKHKDILLKKLMVIAVCVQWFHPKIRYLFRQVDDWSESFCDLKCCELLGDTRHYFNVLLKYATKSEETTSYTTSRLYESGIRGRIRRMKNYQNLKRKGKGLAMAVTTVLVLLGSGTAFAAGNGVLEIYNQVAQSTAVIIIEKLEEEQLQEYTLRLEDSGATEIITVPTPKIIEGQWVDFKEIVEKKQMRKSGSFYASAGKKITITGTITPSNQEIRVGIICPDGIIKAVDSTGSFGYNFSIDKSGTYAVFVQNVTGSSAITFDGHYKLDN